MLRGYATLALAALLGLSACNSSDKKGPLVARGDGVAISADEFKARLDEQSPFIRQRYTTLERKKEFLDNLVRFEVLFNAAKKQGLENDPDVQQTLKKVMVQKLVQKTFNDPSVDPTKEIPEADQRKFYDDHRDDYAKPRKVRLMHILLAATPAAPVASAPKAKSSGVTLTAGTPGRAAQVKQARELLAKIRAEDPKNPAFFAATARERSEEQATKSLGGDLGFKSQDELVKLYGEAFAKAAFDAKDGDLYTVESAQGAHVIKVAGHQEAFDRTFDQVKAQIAGRLLREKRQKDFDEFVKKLREQAHVTVDEAALNTVAAAQPPSLGNPSQPPGAMMMPPPPGAPPPAHPVAPAPPPPAPPAK